MRKKVLILQEYVPRYRLEFFNRLVQSAARMDIDVMVAAGDPHGFMADRKDAVQERFIIPVRQKEFSLLGKRFVVRNSRPLTKAADLVVLEQARRNLDAYQLLLPGFLRRNLITLWGHGMDYVKGPNHFERLLSKILTNRSDWFFAYTQAGSEHVARGGYDSRRVTVLNNTIDTGELRDMVSQVSGESLLQFCKQHALHGKTAVFMGGLDESKRIPFLLKAAEEVHSKDGLFRLLIVGSGSLSSYVSDFAKTRPWIIDLGSLQGFEKAVALKAAQVISMPGRVGLIAVDSFAASRPIITTDWAWHAPEYGYLVPGQNAIVTRDSVTDYAQGLLNTLNDQVLLKRLQDRASESYPLYSLESMVDSFLSGILSAFDTKK